MKMPPSAARFLMSFTGKRRVSFSNTCGGSFMEQEAREWMEEHSSVDLYEEIFGEVEE